MRYVIVIVLSWMVSSLALAERTRATHVEMRRRGSKSVPSLVEATIRHENYNGGTKPSGSVSQNISTVGCGFPTDQAGHAIPFVLGGTGTVNNIYPLETATNRALGDWERKLGQQLDKRVCVTIDYKVELTFGDDNLELRPTEVHIEARCHHSDGHIVTETQDLKNPKPRTCATKTYPDK